jgi:hypothetical protein
MPAMVLRLSPESKAQTGPGAWATRGQRKLPGCFFRRPRKPDERADFFERATGHRKRGVVIRTNWADMRIAENAWRRFATAAKRLTLRFRVHGGQAQTGVPSNSALSNRWQHFHARASQSVHLSARLSWQSACELGRGTLGEWGG